MEAFEHIAKVYLETQGYAVSTNVKFPVRRKTQKQSCEEYQVHGYEVDLVAARADELLLGSVKSFLGSQGLNRQFFSGIADESKTTLFKQAALFNEPEVQEGVLAGCVERFKYPREKINLALFAGKFKKGDHESAIRTHLQAQHFGGGAVRVFDLRTIAAGVVAEAAKKTYRDDPVIVAIKCLHELKWLTNDYAEVAGMSSGFQSSPVAERRQ
jgi:hypothetical protein